jgi:hypothetical protein
MLKLFFNKVIQKYLELYEFSFNDFILFFRQIKLYQKILISSFFLLLLIITFIRGLEQDQNGDFFVFWNAGRNFFSNFDLYFIAGKDRQFLYPPFAALVFSLIFILPFKISALFWALCELVFWYYCILLSKKIIELNSNIKIKWFSIFMSIIFTFNIYLDNLSLLQVNSFVFILLLISMYQLSLNNLKTSTIFLALAISIKVTPVIFLIWFIITGKWKNLFYTSAFAAIFLLAAFLLRGFSLGMNDLTQFYLTLINEVPKIQEIKHYSLSLSLSGLISNYFQIFNINNADIQSIISILIQIVFVITFILWMYLNRKHESVTKNFQISGVLLLMLLISAVTRKAHLAPLLLVFLSILSYTLNNRNSKLNYYLLKTTYFIGFIFLFSGRDLIGNANVELLYKYSIFTVLLLMLFIINIVLSFSSIKNNTMETFEK